MTKEECLAQGGHCWGETNYDRDWGVKERWCKHCRVHQMLKAPTWETIEPLVSRSKTGPELQGAEGYV